MTLHCIGLGCFFTSPGRIEKLPICPQRTEADTVDQRFGSGLRVDFCSRGRNPECGEPEVPRIGHLNINNNNNSLIF